MYDIYKSYSVSSKAVDFTYNVDKILLVGKNLHPLTSRQNTDM